MLDGKRHYFDNYHMHHLFYDVYSNARTGILKVYFPDEVVKTVYFSEGNTIYASSNGEKDKLVNILIKYKKISKEQLETALRQMDKSISLGRNLVNMGFITHKELIWAVKVQVIGIMHSIITLEEGECQFSEGPLPDGVINLPLNTMKVLFDSLLMFQDRSWIAEQVHQPDSIFKKTVLFEEGKSRLITNDELMKVAEAIDGTRSTSDLAGLTTLEDFKVFKLLYALRFLNLIEEKVTSGELPTQEQIFDIADEPDEDLELAQESFAQLGEEDQQEEEQPEEDELETPFGEIEDDEDDVEPVGTLDLEEPEEEKIDIDDDSDVLAPDQAAGSQDEMGLPDADQTVRIPTGDVTESEQGDDVYVEFQLEEDELSYEEGEDRKPAGVVDTLINHGSAQRGVDDTVPIRAAASERELKLTEDDLDSVIMDDETTSPEQEQDTQKLERPELNFSDASVEVPADSMSESMDGEIVMTDSSSGGKWFLVLLVLLAIALMAGTLYYYMFWLPQNSEQQSMLSSQQSEEAVTEAMQPDVTEQTVQPGETGELEQTPATDMEQTAETPASTSMTETPQQKPASTVPEESEVTEPESQTAGKPDVASQTEPEQNRSVQQGTEHPAEKPAQSVQGKKESTTTTVPTQAPDSASGSYGVYVEQARDAFAVNRDGYTLQIEVACEPDTLDTAVEILSPSDSIYFVPFSYRSKDCYIVCFGIFPTQEAAEQARMQLPEVFFEDNNPFVATVQGLSGRF